jgi:hypothetical protein
MATMPGGVRALRGRDAAAPRRRPVKLSDGGCGVVAQRIVCSGPACPEALCWMFCFPPKCHCDGSGRELNRAVGILSDGPCADIIYRESCQSGKSWLIRPVCPSAAVGISRPQRLYATN